MSPEESTLIEKRRAAFNEFYSELMPVLVDFVGKMGINPAHEVLKHAIDFLPLLDQALQNLEIADEQDKIWLLTRVGYFIGEFFAQKYSGLWYLNEIPKSRYFGRYVVGKFTSVKNETLMIDPFEIAQDFISQKAPRNLKGLISEVELEINKFL